MKKVRAFLLIQRKILFRQPSVALVFFGLPILGALFIGFALQPLFAAKPFVDPFAVAVVDNDQSLETRMIIQQLAADEEFSKVVQFRNMDIEEGLAQLKADQVAAMVVIPENFAGNLRAGRNLPFEVVGNPQRPLEYGLFLATMESGAGLISAAQSGVNTVHHFLRGQVTAAVLDEEVNKAIVAFTLQSLGRGQVFKATKLTGTGSFTLTEYYIAAGSVILIFLMGLYLLTALRQEHAAGLEKRLFSRGVGAGTKIAAKFITLFSGFCLLQVALLVLYLAALGGRVTGSWPGLAVVMVASAASAAMFFTFISSLRLPPFGELAAAGVFSALLMVLGGNLLPLSFLPQWLGVLSRGALTYWMREGYLHGAFIYEPSLLLTSVGVMAGATLLLLAASALAESTLGRRGR